MGTHKTYRGLVVDVSSIYRQNEKAVAVGNMKVNARGDTIGSNGQVIETADQKARKFIDTTKTASHRVGLKPDVVDTLPASTSTTERETDELVEDQNGDLVPKSKRGR